MRKIFSVASTVTIVMLALFTPATAESAVSRSPKSHEFSATVIDGQQGFQQQATLTLTFASRPSAADIQAVRSLLQGNHDEGLISTKKSASNFTELNCKYSYGWIDENGYYSRQHQSGGNTAPWDCGFLGPGRALLLVLFRNLG